MIELTVITDENIDDMMDAAGYGITYWARASTLDVTTTVAPA